MFDNRSRKKKLTRTKTVDPRLIDPADLRQIEPVLHNIINASLEAAIKDGKIAKDTHKTYFRSGPIFFVGVVIVLKMQ